MSAGLLVITFFIYYRTEYKRSRTRVGDTAQEKSPKTWKNLATSIKGLVWLVLA